ATIPTAIPPVPGGASMRSIAPRAAVALAATFAVLTFGPQRSFGQEAARTVLTASAGPGDEEWKRVFNPFRDYTATRWPAKAGIYEPLVVFNRATGTYLPWLAAAYQWGAGNRTLLFSIRPGVVWSDGAAFSARDVAFTFELLRRFPALDLH